MLDHALLAGILGTLKDEDVRRGNTVLDEELGLECILGEVFDHNAWLDLYGERADQGEHLGFIIGVFEASEADEITKADAGHVGAFAQGLAESAFA